MDVRNSIFVQRVYTLVQEDVSTDIGIDEHLRPSSELLEAAWLIDSHGIVGWYILGIMNSSIGNFKAGIWWDISLGGPFLWFRWTMSWTWSWTISSVATGGAPVNVAFLDESCSIRRKQTWNLPTVNVKMPRTPPAEKNSETPAPRLVGDFQYGLVQCSIGRHHYLRRVSTTKHCPFFSNDWRKDVQREPPIAFQRLEMPCISTGSSSFFSGGDRRRRLRTASAGWIWATVDFMRLLLIFSKRRHQGELPPVGHWPAHRPAQHLAVKSLQCCESS